MHRNPVYALAAVPAGKDRHCDAGHALAGVDSNSAEAVLMQFAADKASRNKLILSLAETLWSEPVFQDFLSNKVERLEDEQEALRVSQSIKAVVYKLATLRVDYDLNVDYLKRRLCRCCKGRKFVQKRDTKLYRECRNCSGRGWHKISESRIRQQLDVKDYQWRQVYSVLWRKSAATIADWQSNGLQWLRSRLSSEECCEHD